MYNFRNYRKPFQTVRYEQPDKKTGRTVSRVSDCAVDQLEWFTKRIEKHGGKVLSVEPPRQLTMIDVD